MSQETSQRIGFQTPLVLKGVCHREWEVYEPLVYKTPLTDLTVPKGFRTDLASIPWGLRGIFPRDVRTASAAVVHDYAYRVIGHSRSMSDAIFRDALKYSGVGGFTRTLMYLGVRLGGWTSFNRG